MLWQSLADLATGDEEQLVDAGKSLAECNGIGVVGGADLDAGGGEIGCLAVSRTIATMLSAGTPRSCSAAMARRPRCPAAPVTAMVMCLLLLGPLAEARKLSSFDFPTTYTLTFQ